MNSETTRLDAMYKALRESRQALNCLRATRGTSHDPVGDSAAISDLSETIRQLVNKIFELELQRGFTSPPLKTLDEVAGNGEIYTNAEWIEGYHVFSPYDGAGYYATATQCSRAFVPFPFIERPGFTHVVWYNK